MKINKKSTRAVREVKYQAEIAADPTLTTNLAGGQAFGMAERQELFTRVMSCFFSEPKFYGNVGDTEKRIFELVKSIVKTDPEWLFHLAKFLRHEGYMRTMPVVLMVESAIALSKHEFATKKLKGEVSNKVAVRPFVSQIVSRADEIAEALSYFISKYDSDKQMPLGLRKGLADSFQNFNAYQLLKYDREGEVSLADAINILHPKAVNPKTKALDKDMVYLYEYLRGWTFHEKEIKEMLTRLDGRQAIIHKTAIDKDVLEAVSKGNITWEVFISHFGGNTASWTAIAQYMPYMATMRNLSNMIENEVPAEVMKAVAAKLENEHAIAKAKQFPFRYHSAHKELANCGKRVPSFIVKALSNALETSIKNIPQLGGVTAVFSDNSGSMHSPISQKSTVEMIDIGAMMSAMAFHFSDDAYVGAFGETFKWVTMNPKDSILTNMEKVRNCNVGMSTNGWLAIEALIAKKTKVDRILVFSDMQCYNSVGYGYSSRTSLQSALKEYKRTVNPNVKLYSFDLSGYGTAQFTESEAGVYQLAGFSDKIFKFMEIVESGTNMVDVIAKY